MEILHRTAATYHNLQNYEFELTVDTVRGQFARKESYTLPLLLGAEPGVSAKYYVEQYPTTFVADREVRITFRGFAGQSPKDLRAAVESALRRRP